jgi:predicted SAM-dependent methyltransferase
MGGSLGDYLGWALLPRGEHYYRRVADPVDPFPEPFDPSRYPDKLNLGCGWDIRDGYLNVDLHDFHKPDLVADVTRLDMLPSGAYTEIIAQDVLEHLPRQSTVEVLREWSRLLRVGGKLHVRVPSVIDLAELMKLPANQTISQQELLVQCLFGTQAYTEDCHYTTFTEPLLRHYLGEANLKAETWEMRDGWLFEVDARKLASKPTPEAAKEAHAPGWQSPFGERWTNRLRQVRGALASAREQLKR